MIISGNISKMRAELLNPVEYFMPFGDKELPMNNVIGKKISFKFSGQINCISCGKQTKTSFGQGFCYSCLQTAPEASETVIRPELSKAHLGIARDMEWAKEHDLIDHFVYLAISGELKVGVTRHHQVPTRWIDQGASEAIILAKTFNRHVAGIIEVFLKNYFSDKTNWRTMLQGKITGDINLIEEKAKAADLLPGELKQYLYSNDEICKIKYPGAHGADKISSLSFDKESVISGKLSGIRGQYLIFSDGRVLNIRKHNGYFLDVSVNE